MAEPAPPPAGPIPLDLPAGVHQLCNCGRSRDGWFCDGAHLGSGRLFRGLRLESACTVMICGCGHSHSYPLCDGSHARPAAPKRWWLRWLP